MICINCFHNKTLVANSRRHKKRPVVWRRRHCPSCQRVFTTYERIDLEKATVTIGQPRQHQPFSLGKLAVSIARSFHHSKHSSDFDSLALAETVQETLLSEQTVLTNDNIAAVTHLVLSRFDPLAAIQYAAQHDLISTGRSRPGRPATFYRRPGSEDHTEAAVSLDG